MDKFKIAVNFLEMVSGAAHQINTRCLYVFDTPPLPQASRKIAQKQAFAATHVQHLEGTTPLCLCPITDHPRGQQRFHVIFPGGVGFVVRMQFRVKLFGLIHGKMAEWILFADGWQSKKAFLCRRLQR